MSEVEGNQYAVLQPYGVVVLRVTCRMLRTWLGSEGTRQIVTKKVAKEVVRPSGTKVYGDSKEFSVERERIQGDMERT
jgi:hypothetical protein